jgi:DNA-binding NtrC family response regulator
MGSPGTLKNPLSILVVDDEPSMLRYLRMLLEVDSHQVETVSSGFAAIERVQRDPAPDVVLLDLLMPHMDGMQALEQLRQLRPGLKVIMLTCANDPRKAVQAIRLGAHDYLTKPFHKAELDAALQSCLATPPATAAPTAWEGKVDELGDGSIFVAASPAMQKIRAQALQVANINVPVLLLGESGTGKEVVARFIWKFSARAHRTFMKVNCAALPAELLESELFGFEAGAFTGATRAKPGKFELCDKGTFLLDEIAEMPPGLQAKLLHVLQDQEFSRLGSRSSIAVDVRILAATNVNVEQALATKKLREDLYYRLNAFTLHLPPLRERKEEIPLLLKQFMALWADRYARPPLPLSQSFIDACSRYSWPGNVRELENLVKRYLILGDELLVLSDLEANAREPAPSQAALPAPAARQPGELKSSARGSKDEAEADTIARALEHTKWNRKEAARLLNISHKTLLDKIRQYGLEAR